MDEQSTFTVEEFVEACEQFCKISDKTGDGWKLNKNEIDKHKCFIQKSCFFQHKVDDVDVLLKADYVVFYNLSYGVPSFSFNVWNSSGVLLTLEDIRQMSFINVNKENFYSVITQQEHPVMFRPYFIMHPCHTATLLADFKDVSKNIIVTFLGLITPLLKLDLPYEYGL